MVKRRCPHCSELMFSAMEDNLWECKCGTVLGPELNMGADETEISQIIFPKVGDVLGGDYQVLAVHKKEYALGVNKNAAEPYVTWHLDQYGNTYSGEYFKTANEAERHFTALCFKWFDDSDELGLAISILNRFKWNRNVFVMEYDRESGEILFSEQELMKMIIMANPAQEPTAIRLISHDEIKEYSRLNSLPIAKVIVPSSRPQEKPTGSGVVIDMERMNANASQKENLKKAIEKFGVPDKAYFDNPDKTEGQ